MTKKYLLVFGGSGFVGKELCHQAVMKNVPVVSISLRGKPRTQEKWLDSPFITWLAIDIFNSYAWHDYVKNAFAVVHLVGILSQNSNKTYEKLNMASVIMTSEITKQQADENIPYLFLSAEKSPILPKKYLQTKQEAENYIASLSLPATIIRSGYIFGKERKKSIVISKLIRLLAKMPFINTFFSPIFPVDNKKLATFLLDKSTSLTTSNKTSIISTRSL